MSNYCSDVVWKRAFGDRSKKAVASRLADHADDEGRGIWPSVERVAAQTELSERTVQRVLDAFVKDGILIVVDEGGRGPGSTRRYDFDMAKVEALPLAEWGRNKGRKKGDTMSPLPQSKGDTVSDKGDNHDTEGCHRDTQTPIEPSTEPSRERVRASADDAGAKEREREGVEPATSGKPDASTVPGTAAFRKRVVRFCSGAGYSAGPWKNWDAEKSASIDWITDKFAELEEPDRQHAERWRDAYLRDIAQRKLNPQKVGIFIRDRMWEGLDPNLLLKAERAAAQGARPAEHAKPEGWAVSMGPVWAALVFATLIRGPEHPEHAPPDGGMWLAIHKARAWPKIASLFQLANDNRGFVAPERFHDLRDAMEFVKDGCAVWQDWMAEFQRRGWPDLPRREGMDGLYMPKGGPGFIAAFEEALAGQPQKTSEAAQ